MDSVSHSVILCVLLGSVAIPSEEMIYPKYRTFFLQEWTFGGLYFQVDFLSRCVKCSWNEWPKMIRSSRHTKHSVHRFHDRARFINLWKVAGALQRRNKCSLFPILLCSAHLPIATEQVNHLDPDNACNVSSEGMCLCASQHLAFCNPCKNAWTHLSS